ncbi:ribosomal protein S18 acetylase RimI-like enzyme [Anaerotaenia torta]|uniref:GNAT family N-acetyltransferase n=1 Tax=Anaerotaenia torta TaxID=433293 RepID=UPI003D19EB22
MNLKYIRVKKDDADLVIQIYNAAFYDDYIKYGECPAYGRTRASMESSIEEIPKHIIYDDDNPIGALSVADRGNGDYYLGCLCVLPEFQGKGIGTQAFQFILEFYSDWNKLTLVTPADKEDNIAFYTKKCGFKIDRTEMDGDLKIVHFLLEREDTVKG